MNAPLGEFSDYDGLRRALNAAREKRNISLSKLNEITGAPDGYFEKLLGPRSVRRIGLQSLGWALGGLGIKCILVEDPEALERVEGRFVDRDEAHLASVLNGVVHIQVNRSHYRKIGVLGGANSRKNLGKRKRRKLAKAAAMVRWGKVKSKSKEQARRARQRKATHKARKGS
jgi:hypothetical protein